VVREIKQPADLATDQRAVFVFGNELGVLRSLVVTTTASDLFGMLGQWRSRFTDQVVRNEEGVKRSGVRVPHVPWIFAG